MGKSKGTPLIHKVAFLGSALILIGAFLPQSPKTWSYFYAGIKTLGSWRGFFLIFPLVGLLTVFLEFTKRNIALGRFFFGLLIILGLGCYHTNAYRNFSSLFDIIKYLNFGMLASLVGSILLFSSAFMKQPYKD